ncbi:MAG TPA: hypothetical protein VLB46_09185 [Pyrinomonadaceae bacterium]|nr:hypothetical protein [Pyrinomonadaceae bacterium]
MNAHLQSYLVPVIGAFALSLCAGCHLSTNESRAQIANVGNQKSLSASRDEIKLLPVDESNLDPSFQEFRNQLINAVRNRDKVFVLTVLAQDIKNGYDIEPGVNEFRRRWRPSDPESSVWHVLTGVLAGGGSFNNSHTQFCGPYFISQWPKVVQQLPKGTDTLDYVAITGKDVPVRRDAHVTAPVVATLSYDVVKSIPDSQILDRSTPGASSWVKVKTATGQEGFVLDSYIGGPLDYGVCFTKKNAKWMMTELAARE